MNPTSIMLNVIFSCVGASYFIYGKKSERWNFIVFGAILCFWPYFISNLWIEVIGDIILCGLPFLIEF